MVIKNHINYDWERFLETQSLEAIDNFIVRTVNPSIA